MKFVRALLMLLAMFIVHKGTLTADAPWTPPLNVSTIGVDPDSPQVAIDLAGNAVAVWTETDPNSTFIRINSSTAPFGGPWTTPVFISPDGENAADPHVAVDAAGNATAVWDRNVGTNKTIQYATKPFGAAWNGALDLTSTSEIATTPQIAVNASGKAVVVWEFDGATSIIRAATFDGAVWTTSPDLSNSAQNARVPQVGIDAAGNAVAVWTWFDGSNDITQASNFNGTAWSVTPTDLSAAGQDAEEPQVSVNASGVAVAVWDRLDGANFIVQTKTFNGSVWSGTTVDISPTGINGFKPDIAIDANGNAAIVWTTSSDTIEAATLPFGSTSPTLQTLDLGPLANNPHVGINTNGYAVAVWEQTSVPFNYIKGSTLVGGVWTAPVNIQTNSSSLNLIRSQVAVSPTGRAVAIWLNGTEGDAFIQASFLDILGSVTNLSGRQCCNRFLTQSEIFNVLRWNPPSVGSPVEYRIYRDAGLTQLIGVVPANSNPLRFVDHARKKQVTYTYYVVAVDASNSVSIAAIVTVTPSRHCK